MALITTMLSTIIGGSETFTNLTVTGTINGAVITAPTTTVGGNVKLAEGTNNGTNTITLQAPASTADVTATFQAASGTVAYTADIPTGANQAAQETGTSTTTFVSPGVQQYHASAAKCWARIDDSAGTPTLAVSYNVTSLTDNAAGDFTVNFTVAFSSANYGAFYTGSDIGSGDVRFGWLTGGAPTTTTCRFLSANASLSGTDGTARFVAFFGDQ